MKINEQINFDSGIPRDRLAMRKKARAEFRQLVESIDVQSSSSKQAAYAQEVERRLNQLEILTKCIDKIDREIAKRLSAFHNICPQVVEFPPKLFHRKEEKQIAFLESYYLIAWRMLEAAKHVKGFERIDKKATGIATVRNRLIQHPECNGVYEWSHATVGTTGNIKLKPLPLVAGQPRFLDRGFANNDLELHASMFSAAFNQRHKIK